MSALTFKMDDTLKAIINHARAAKEFTPCYGAKPETGRYPCMGALAVQALERSRRQYSRTRPEGIAMPKLTIEQRQANALRRARGENIIAMYGANHGDPNDWRSNLIDLLADLMHCEGHRKSLWRANEQFDSALRSARGHFEAERQGEN